MRIKKKNTRKTQNEEKCHFYGSVDNVVEHKGREVPRRHTLNVIYIVGTHFVCGIYF